MAPEEKHAKAQDLIGFLAAFDISHEEAYNILDRAKQSCGFMTDNEYKETGKNLGAFLQLLQGTKTQ